MVASSSEIDPSTSPPAQPARGLRTPWIDRIATSAPATILLTAFLATVVVASWYLEGVFATSIVMIFASWSILELASARQKATGRRVVLSRSPRRWTSAIALALLFVAANVGSFVALANGRSDLCLPIAAASFVPFAAGLWFDERFTGSAASTP